MHDILQDLKYALRQLRKSPGFTTVAVLTLALGLGANSALFSVINGVLLNPLPFPNPDQLVALHENKPNFQGGSISYANFRDWQKDNHTFAAMAVARPYAFSLTGTGEPEQVNAEFVTSDFFSLLGVTPVLGRSFATGEDEIGGPPLALVSEGFWKRKLGSDPGVLGRVSPSTDAATPSSAWYPPASICLSPDFAIAKYMRPSASGPIICSPIAARDWASTALAD